ncbi:MAG: hypothetical protein HQ518_01300 [Rhodopirellula sp.]|nr:hypothetical protein [Rhodopirellula sp.]
MLEDAAQETSSPVLSELAADLFVKLSNKQTTEEENQSLQELLSAKKVLAKKAALDVLLATQTTGPDETLCHHIEKLIQSDSTEDQQWMVQRLSECPVVTVPLRETICRALRREPNLNGTKRLALLLAKTNPVPPEAIPGLIQAITQPVPQAGGMCCSTQSSVNRQLVLNERQMASRALNELPHTDIAAVPIFMRLLDHPQLEVRRQAVAHLRQFGSLAVVALPKLLTMNTRDERLVVLSKHSWSFPGPSFQSEVNGAVQSISWSTLSKLNVPLQYRILVAICLEERSLRAENKTLLGEVVDRCQFAWLVLNRHSADK